MYLKGSGDVLMTVCSLRRCVFSSVITVAPETYTQQHVFWNFAAATGADSGGFRGVVVKVNLFVTCPSMGLCSVSCLDCMMCVCDRNVVFHWDQGCCGV